MDGCNCNAKCGLRGGPHNKFIIFICGLELETRRQLIISAQLMYSTCLMT